MSRPEKRPSRYIGPKRARARAPIASILVVLALIIACAAFLGFSYLWGNNNDEDANGIAPEQNINNPPTETPTELPPSQEATTDAEEITPHSKVPAVVAKGLYVDAWSTSVESNIAGYIELSETTQINALVIDVKDDWGHITYLSEDELLSAASRNYIPNIAQVVSRLKEHGIYTIARLVCFKDPLWSELRPDLAIRDRRGGTWEDAGRVAWLNPYDKENWEYLAAAALDAARIGFDEIQLDYVRFPADGSLPNMDFGGAVENTSKAEIIGEFLQYIRQALAETSAWLSADVFGIIAVSSGDFEGIGQDLDIMLQHVDYICPMIYPSHFANKSQNGVGQIINNILFEIPDTDPYGVILNILLLVKDRLPADGNHAIIRPFLQAFTASYLGPGNYIPYTSREIAAQIQAVYDAGFEEWLMWNQIGSFNAYENVISLMRSENSDGSSSGTPAVSSD